jgi:large subunit ribosomal protein L24
MSKWIRKGDQVIVTAGNERGKTGKVLSRKLDRVIVQGINLRKKHMKRRAQGMPRILDMEVPIHISNVSLCSTEGKPVRLRVKGDNKGERQLVYSENGKEVAYRSVKKHAG